MGSENASEAITFLNHKSEGNTSFRASGNSLGCCISL